MKILRIRGENLASLAGPFEIDLEGGALGRAGLFAITGPTGSGKSSILDAVCLALYNEVPRTAGQTNRSKAPAGGEAELSLSDPRHVLRRGAGEGHAEVEFRATDGDVYTARWEVHRSRRRPSGNLQSQKMSLRDARGQGTGGATNRSVLDAIVALTGLTFDQFRRAVLLAQGDFAAFLKAGTEDRANLLEAMTGTDIYGTLSVLAHERRKEWEDKIALAQSQLAWSAPMESEARAALEAQKIAADEGIAATHKERTATAEVLAWYKALDQRDHALATAHRQVEAAEAAAQAAEPRRMELAAATRAWALRLPVRNVRAMEGKLAQLEQAQREAQKTCQDATDASHKAALTHTAARTNLAAASTAYVAALARALADERARAAAVRSWLTTNAAIQPFAMPGRLADIGELMAAWTRLEESIPRATQLAEQAAEAIATREKALPTLLGTATRAQAASDVAGQAEAVARATLDHHEPEQLDERARTHASHRRALDALVSMAKQLAELEAQQRALQGQRDAHQSAARDAQAAVTKLGPELAAAKGRLEEARRTLDTYRRALSADDWRANLAPDTECPVCGSLDHPWADGTALPALHSEHQQRVLSLDTAHAKLRDDHAAHVTAHTAAQTELTRTAAALVDNEARRTELTAKQREVIADLAPLDVSDLEEAERALERDGAAIAALRATLDRDTRAVIQAAEQSSAASKHAARAQRAHADAEADIARLRSEHALALAKIATDRERRDELTTTLTRALEPLAIAPHWRNVAETRACLEDIASRVDQWRTNETERDTLDAAIAERAELHAGATEALAQDASGADTSQEHAPAPPPHVAATGLVAWYGTQRTALRDRVREASELVETTKEARAAAEMAQAIAASAHAGHAAELAAKRAELQDELTAAALRVEEVERWLERDDQWREQEAEAISVIDKARVSAQAVVDSQTADLATYRATQPEHGREQATRALEALDAKLDEQRKAASALGAALLADDEKQRAASEGAATLEALRVEATPWLQIADLIGHNKGKTFKSYAQAVTLGILLRGANRHLRELNPRYELRVSNLTELEVEVVDHDLADERRSVHHLSGGETFLTSLALALALSEVAARRVQLGTLFIDEGLGTLDIDTLDVALGILENLRDTGRQVGLISHVQGLAERVAARIDVVPLGGGKSRIELPNAS